MIFSIVYMKASPMLIIRSLKIKYFYIQARYLR